jgi:glutamate dehydrogenase
MLRALAGEALRTDGATDPEGQIAAWKRRNAVLYERVRQVLTELRAAETPDLAMLSVAMRELRNLATR